MKYSLYYNFNKVADIKILAPKIGFFFRSIEYGKVEVICTYKFGLKNKLYIDTIELETCYNATLNPNNKYYCGACIKVPKNKQKEFIKKAFLELTSQYKKNEK